MPAQVTSAQNNPPPNQNKVGTENLGVNEVVQEKELFSWRQKSRPFRKRSKKFWIKLLSIVTILFLILYIAEGAMPIILGIAVLFLFYILSTVEPEEIGYSITNFGVKIERARTDWAMISRFWFTTRNGSELLIFETANFPGRLQMVVEPKDKEELRGILKKYVIEEEAEPSGFDKFTNWIFDKLPG